MQINIDTSKEQLIISFENWYAAEFEQPANPQPVTGPLSEPRDVFSAQDKRESEESMRLGSKGGIFSDKADDLEDEDAAVYRRAKQAVEELHRARKFEKSIKL